MRIVILVCLCLFATTVYAGEWIADKKTGCKVWNPAPVPNESVSWSGKCEGEIANGQGILQWFVDNKPDASSYEGFLKNGLKDGKGTVTHTDGSKFVGEFKDGKKNGNGTYTFKDGSKFVGEFKDDIQSGNATHIFADGSQYVGEFKGGVLSI